MWLPSILIREVIDRKADWESAVEDHNRRVYDQESLSNYELVSFMTILRLIISPRALLLAP